MTDTAATTATAHTTQRVRLTQASDFQFDVHFADALPLLRADEPPPLGQGAGPTPVQLLAASVGNCLSASLLFALRKFKQAPEPITCSVDAEVGRNADGRVRVLALHARLTLGVPAASLQQLERVLASFEGYCTVTQSVRAAIPVDVQVVDARGERLL
ncbi:MAG: OsmC family protein [Leptothrix sp. (in: b-proteobacteria)]